ncbi:MarR family winged helix-turn-helix transcriptional regulator [Streptomyces sp. NPDC087844]|uniref:MarR family winged helix-turn-helix transcriptional regulator n=1 Tax=Streptomyces sp. NPDC087844 TaxID=3365805 RepID=UPI003819B8E9
MPSQADTAVLAHQVATLSQLIREHMSDLLQELDITEPLANLLWYADAQADPVPLRRLAVRLHCDPSNVTLMCAKLEEKGLAQRRPHPKDGRVRTLVATEAGRVVRDRLLERAHATPSLSALDTDERTALQTLLSKALAAGK